MAKYLKPQTPLQHQSGDYIYPITSVDQIVTGNGERLNANLISIDLKNSVESDKVVLGTQAVPFSIQEGGTGANNAAEARENLGITPENIGAISMELLWKNSSPTSDFVTQTISLNLANFDLVCVTFYANKSGQQVNGCSFFRPGEIFDLRVTLASSINARRNNASDANGIWFNSGMTYQFGNNTGTAADYGIIPNEIYGLKGVTA